MIKNLLINYKWSVDFNFTAAEVDGSMPESDKDVVNEHLRNKRDTVTSQFHDQGAVTSRLLDIVTRGKGRRHLQKSWHHDSKLSLRNVKSLGGGWGLSKSGLIWTDVYDGKDS